MHVQRGGDPEWSRGFDSAEGCGFEGIFMHDEPGKSRVQEMISTLKLPYLGDKFTSNMIMHVAWRQDTHSH